MFIIICVQDIKISALALLKMVMHARSGGNLEIMGLLLGKVRSRDIVKNVKVVLMIMIHKDTRKFIGL